MFRQRCDEQVAKIRFTGIADGDIVAVSDILRRTTAHLVSGSQESIDIAKSSLTDALTHVVQIVRSSDNNLSSEAAASLYDAAMRLVRHIDGSLFDSVTCLALQAGIRGVKQELISSWQQL